MKSSLKPAGSHDGLLVRAKRAAACSSLTSPSSVHKATPRLAVEDGAACVAWPGWPRRAVRGRRTPCGCHNAGYQGSPRGGSSSARPGRPSQVRAGGIAISRALGGRTMPDVGRHSVRLGEQRLDEAPAGIHLASGSTFSTHGGPTGGRTTPGPRYRNVGGIRGTRSRGTKGGRGPIPVDGTGSAAGLVPAAAAPCAGCGTANPAGAAWGGALWMAYRGCGMGLALWPPERARWAASAAASMAPASSASALAASKSGPGLAATH